MNFSVNPIMWQNVFAIPATIADEYLRTASALQLKVLIRAMRGNMNIDPSQIAKLLIVPEEEVKDALMFWVSRGVLLADGVNLITQQGNTAPKPQTETKPKTEVKPTASEQKPQRKNDAAARAVARMQKPTVAEVVKRAEQSADVKYLLSEAQRKLGRTLSTNELQTFVWLFDYCNLPAGVLLMITEYAVSCGRGSMRYIEKLTLQWTDEGISTIFDAEKKIHEAKNIDSAWIRLQRLFGMEQRKPTKYEEGFADRVVNKWKFSDEMISYAYDECVDHIGKYKATYINKVLNRFFDEHITTVTEIEKKSQQTNETTAAGGDDAYMKMAMNGPRRRKKAKED